MYSANLRKQVIGPLVTEDGVCMRAAFFDFASCEGCQLQVANLEEDILKLVSACDIASFREIMKESSDSYDIAFIEGSIIRPMDEERLKKIRGNAKILVALGDCACNGGVNKLSTGYSRDDLVNEVYGTDMRDSPLFETTGAKAVDEVVGVDLYIYGCPVRKERVLYYTEKILSGTFSRNASSYFDMPQRKRTVDRRSVVQYDPEKCILCRRCDTICGSALGIHALGPVQRGPRTTIGTPENVGFDNNGCIRCGQCVYFCPVGALSTGSTAGTVREALRNDKCVVAIDTIALASFVEHDPAMSSVGFEEAEKRVIVAMRQIGFDKVVQYDHYLEESLQDDARKEEGMLSWCMGAFNYMNGTGREEDDSNAPWILYAKEFPQHKRALITPCTAMKSSGIDIVLSAMELEELLREMGIRLDLVTAANENNCRYDNAPAKTHPGVALPADLSGRVRSIRMGSAPIPQGNGLYEVYPCLRRCLTGGGNYPRMDTAFVEHLKEVLE
jgi:coenzyme F420-reducing hydrogenase gamma subunit